MWRMHTHKENRAHKKHARARRTHRGGGERTIRDLSHHITVTATIDSPHAGKRARKHSHGTQERKTLSRSCRKRERSTRRGSGKKRSTEGESKPHHEEGQGESAHPVRGQKRQHHIEDPRVPASSPRHATVHPFAMHPLLFCLSFRSLTTSPAGRQPRCAAQRQAAPPGKRSAPRRSPPTRP